mgnify:FL=1
MKTTYSLGFPSPSPSPSLSHTHTQGPKKEMKITVMMLSDDRILSLDVEPEEPAENVKALLEVETGVPLANQQLLHNSRELPNSASLRSSGVREGDLLMMQVAGPSPGPGSGSGLGSGSGSGSGSQAQAL